MSPLHNLLSGILARTIKGEEILSPIVISTEAGQQILEARIRKTSRPLINLTIDTARIDQGKVLVAWRILEKGDGAVIQLIYAGDQEVALRVSGSVVGQSNPIELAYSGKLRSPEEQYSRSARIDRILGIVALGASLILFVPWLVLLVLRRRLRSAEASFLPMLTVRMALVAGCVSVGTGLWMLFRSRQPGPPFGF